MKQRQILAAYQAVTQLYKIEGLPFCISMDLYLLKKKLDPYIELEAEKERTLFAANGDNGVLTQAMKRELSKILDAEVEWNEDPPLFKLGYDLIHKMNITGELLDKLDGFVIFEAVYEEGQKSEG